MKKVLLTAAMVLTATSAFAFSASPGNHSIVNTPHNLATIGLGGESTANTEGQICIYCHTPHNPVVAIPLWNRTDASATFTALKFYNTSPSLSTEGKAAKLVAGSVSAMCMSCHDGATAMGAIKNTARMNFALDTRTLSTGPAAIATDGFELTNDHPIGFSYTKAYNDILDTNLKRLVDPTVAKNTKMGSNFLFTSDNGTDQMECASCHKVHDDFYAPFLRRSNTASGLCLACHDK